MNDKEKLKYIKKEVTGLNYLNSLLTDALFFYQEKEDLNPQFLYLNNVMKKKFEKVLKIL